MASTHERDLEWFFNQLSDHGLVYNQNKCVFGVSESQFLIFFVFEKGIFLLPDHVQAAVDYPLPETINDLRRFLALIYFYHCFMCNAASEYVFT